MPITIAGSGTITGISVGGIPDGTVDTDVLAANAVTYAKIGTTEQGQLCKAWVNFNGVGTVAISASYNVSSITDNGTGDYTVNFTTAFADNSYAVGCSLNNNDNLYLHGIAIQASSASNVQIVCKQSNQSGSSGFNDYNRVSVAIFR